MLRMVMSEEQQVKTVHLFSNFFAGILVIVRSYDTAVLAAVNKSADNVGMLQLTHLVDPVAHGCD